MTELLRDNDLVSDIVCEFLEVAIHNILYLRKLYPEAIFEPRRKYGVVVYYSRHPELNEYIIQCLKAASFHLKRNQLKSVFVCFEADGHLVERYNFNIHEICDGFEGDSFLLKLEQILRDFYLTVQSSVDCLQSLPTGVKFRVQLKVTEYSNVELNQDPSFESFPWINSTPSKNSPALEIIPLKSIETDYLNLQIYIEKF